MTPDLLEQAADQLLLQHQAQTRGINRGQYPCYREVYLSQKCRAHDWSSGLGDDFAYAARARLELFDRNLAYTLRMIARADLTKAQAFCLYFFIPGRTFDEIALLRLTSHASIHKTVGQALTKVRAAESNSAELGLFDAYKELLRR